MLNPRVLGLGLLAASAAFAQKKEDFQALQRDVALVQADVASLRRSLEEKLESMTALMQQSIETSAKTTAALNGLEQRVNERLAEQQKTLNAPMAEMGAKVNTMTDEFQFVRESVASIDNRMSKLNAQIVDLGNAVRVMQAPPPPPDAATPNAATAPAGPPAGLSADQLYDDARRDMSAGKYDIAMQEFQDYLKWFDKTDYAPNAQFYIGNILYIQAKYEDALTAFGTVLGKYPENANKNAEAMYYKGRTLGQLGDKAAAADEYRAFLKKYPRHELTPKVQAELKSVAGAPAARKKAR